MTTAAKTPPLLDHGTRGRLTFFSIARLLLMMFVLATTVFLRQEVLGDWAIAQIYGALGFSFLFSLVNVSVWDQTMRVRYFIPSQLLYDLLLTSYLVYLTGVNDSVFLFLYLLNILSASAVYQMNGALLVMALSGTTFAAIYYVNINMDGISGWYNLLWNELLFLLTALLCGQFMEEIKKQRQMLELQMANIERLQILNDRLLNSIPAGIALVDDDDYVTNVNQTAMAFLGLSQPPSVRMKYHELFPTIRGVLESWPRMTEAQQLKHSFTLRDEPSTQRFSLQIVRLPGGEEDHGQRILVFQDISQLLELERKLEFESRLAATGELAAGIAHEIRNPLASISGSIELLASRLPLAADSEKKLFAIAQREIRRLNTLVTDFLEFAKPKDHASETFPIASVLEEVSEAIRNRAPMNTATLINHVPADLLVKANRERMKQVFFNLFLNSIEAAEDRAVTVTTTAAKIADGMIQVDVLDDGPGISETVLPRIFDPFFTTKSEGTGLGLSTVAQLVKAAKGHVQALPAEKGAHFRLKFASGAAEELAAVQETG